ncbi:MAG: hypothetical protein GTO45_19145 [Candidatus Aminicenantes bacterium]|nr:hypothetical protein [Candidatus Aminicenantes bacterium]NIM80903.1 hypothetical protein [Candidatus Aminicenantes bacterium]NIN20291.1 hypothetical protein [Candidatus Aminicenantes bacterium]NIN44066.1 hypothetical protein [Candidatus Aminicenantes bacterium]NIN86878.1 hypothetical protein [Candidatus Aminicenantes bacterium]
MYVTPEISKEGAENILSQQKFFFPFRFRKKVILPKRIELIYLPFYLFEVENRCHQCPDEAGKQKEKVAVVLDGLLGDNLFFIRENITYSDRIDKPVCPFVLPRSEARRMALDKYKWLQVEHRLRMKQKFVLGEITESKMIFYPFWVGYYQRGGGYDFRIMDGVSGEVQGVRMRKVFLKALRHLED